MRRLAASTIVVVLLSGVAAAQSAGTARDALSALEERQRAIERQLAEIKGILQTILLQTAVPDSVPPAAPGPPPAVQNDSAIVDVGGSAALGAETAPVVMVGFSDFECPFCAKFARQTLPRLKQDYVDSGRLKYVYRNLPLPMHAFATKAAEAAECARPQERYWQMHDSVFAEQSRLDLPGIMRLAASIGLDTARFSQCLDGQTAPIVARDLNDAKRLGITETPTFLIGRADGDKVNVAFRIRGAQPYADFVAALDKLLAGRTNPRAATAAFPSESRSASGSR